jgi:hypothetical protein
MFKMRFYNLMFNIETFFNKHKTKQNNYWFLKSVNYIADLINQELKQKEKK